MNSYFNDVKYLLLNNNSILGRDICGLVLNYLTDDDFLCVPIYVNKRYLNFTYDSKTQMIAPSDTIPTEKIKFHVGRLHLTMSDTMGDTDKSEMPKRPTKKKYQPKTENPNNLNTNTKSFRIQNLLDLAKEVMTRDYKILMAILWSNMNLEPKIRQLWMAETDVAYDNRDWYFEIHPTNDDKTKNIPNVRLFNNGKMYLNNNRTQILFVTQT